MHWSDFGSLSVTGMFKQAGAASEEGGMPSENEAEMLCSSSHLKKLTPLQLSDRL